MHRHVHDHQQRVILGNIPQSAEAADWSSLPSLKQIIEILDDDVDDALSVDFYYLQRA